MITIFNEAMSHVASNVSRVNRGEQCDTKVDGVCREFEERTNGVRVLNDSPVDCQTPSVTESQREAA